MEVGAIDVTFVIFLLVVSCFIGFFLYPLLGDDVESLFNKKIDFTPDKIPDSEQEILNNCKNLNIENTAYCWRDNIGTFFNYTFRYDRLVEDFDELKRIGGDCSEWTSLYKRLAVESNIKYSTQKWEEVKNISSGHIWLWIWDDDFKCKLDQLYTECLER